MNLWSYLDAHPVWAFVYLVSVCITAISVAEGFARRRPAFQRKPDGKLHVE
jgi:hypothetical protein